MSGLGIAYPPPNELLPIFNSTVYTTDNNNNNQYLNYPVAQGAETITTLSTTNFTLNNTKFALGSGSSATLSDQIAIGASNNTIYIPTPIKSIISPYPLLLTTRDAGCYMFNGSAGGFWAYPMFKSVPDFNNFFGSLYGSPGVVFTTDGIGGLGGLGGYGKIDLSGIDDGYLVMPNYGIKLYTAINYISVNVINYRNTTGQPQYVIATGYVGQGLSARLFYNDTEITA